MTCPQRIESTFTASSVRCPPQPLRPHVVYSSTFEPANPNDHLPALVASCQLLRFQSGEDRSLDVAAGDKHTTPAQAS